MESVCLLSAWSGRYRRRRAVIEGHVDYNDSLLDELARSLLIKRSLATDSRFPDLPPFWTEELIEMINLGLKNNHAMQALDVSSLSEAHSFGPSLRHLWAQFREQVEQAGKSLDGEAFHAFIVNWAGTIPKAYKGKNILVRAKADKALLESPLRWAAQKDPIYPWSCLHAHGELRVKLNDFPDEIMYSLVVNNHDAGAFHEWPAQWERLLIVS